MPIQRSSFHGNQTVVTGIGSARSFKEETTQCHREQSIRKRREKLKNSQRKKARTIVKRVKEEEEEEEEEKKKSVCDRRSGDEKH
ncbi:hypothetical protein SDJN02_02701, partial [Cucurbita argyrosperma subsp. argyrosperma]